MLSQCTRTLRLNGFDDALQVHVSTATLTSPFCSAFTKHIITRDKLRHIQLRFKL
jgi:hypothetical protein